MSSGKFASSRRAAATRPSSSSHSPWMVTSCRYVSRCPGASFRLFSRAPTTAFLAAATSRDSRRGFFARPPRNLESPGGPPSSSSRASSSSWCRSAIWFQIIAWARVRSAGLNASSFARSWIYSVQWWIAPPGSAWGPSQISAQESIPARVDRRRLGGAAEPVDQRLGLVPAHFLDGLDDGPDQDAA